MSDTGNPIGRRAVVDHVYWRGREYESSGIGQQRIAIVGYSHCKEDNEEDNKESTPIVLNNVISGTWSIRFFTSIRNYFGFGSHVDFWEKVVFFNYVPDSMNATTRFDWATDEQINVHKIDSCPSSEQSVPTRFSFTRPRAGKRVRQHARRAPTRRNHHN